MSNINTLINNAVKDIIFDKDYIVLIRDGCYTVISASDFLDYFVNGGQGVCDSVMNCWHIMGDFAGVHIDENGEDEECNCQYDTNPRIHFPKGEGIKIITSEEQAKVPDSMYILAKQTGEELYYELIIVDEAGNKRKQKVPTGSSGGTITGGENSGGGIPIYQGENADKIKIASIKSIDGSVAVSTDQGSVNLEVPVVDGKALIYTEGEPGYNVFKNLSDKKLQFLPLVPDNIAMEYLRNGENEIVALKIGIPSTFQFRTFYVNSAYPFDDGNGTIGKPYRTYAQCYNEYVSPNEANPARPGENYNVAYPKFKGSKIIIQSNISTNINPSINGMILEISADSVFTYTGADLYAFDTEIIYPLIPKTGTILQEAIFMNIKGSGVFTRTHDINRGLVRAWATNRFEDSSHFSPTSSISIDENLEFREAKPVVEGKNWINVQKYINGNLVTLESIYGLPFLATSDSTYQPSVNKSLFNVQYRNTFPAETINFSGSIKIKSFSQSSIYVRDAFLNIKGDIIYSGIVERVAYNGSTSHDTINPTKDNWLFYLPHTGKYQLCADEKSIIFFKGHGAQEREGFGHFGWDASIYKHNTARFNEFVLNFYSVCYFNSFYKLDNLSTDFSLGTGGTGKISELYVPNAQYLVSGGVSNSGDSIYGIGVNAVVLDIKNIRASALNKLVFETKGTVLGLKGQPIISGIITYPNAGGAETAGVPVNGLFKDTSKSGAINTL